MDWQKKGKKSTKPDPDFFQHKVEICGFESQQVWIGMKFGTF